MNKLRNIILAGMLLVELSVPVIGASTTVINQNGVQNIVTPAVTYVNVNPLDVVNNPKFYLHKNIRIKGKFDKFSTLGLDYKPAMKSSEDYISFLIQRPDITDHNIPLSELKIFLKRTEAEKYIDLNSGDIVEFSGKVFSAALGDPWVEVTQFKVISAATKENKK